MRKWIKIRKDIGLKSKLSVMIDGKFVDFPLPDRPLPNKICFKDLWIHYIDYSVIEFLRSNKQIWDRMGTKLTLAVWSYENEGVQPIWDVLASEIWPIFATSIRNLRLAESDHLDKLRRLISPTILSDLDQLDSINSDHLYPDGIGDDGPSATAGQALSKWLHTPSKNGQPKRLFFENYDAEVNLDWVNSFKEAFLRATTSSVSYKIDFQVPKTAIEPFELVNERTKEKLTLLAFEEDVEEDDSDDEYIKWLLKRCPISEKAATDQWENDENWDNNLNNIQFILWSGGINLIGLCRNQRTKKKKKRTKASKCRRTARK